MRIYKNLTFIIRHVSNNPESFSSGELVHIKEHLIILPCSFLNSFSVRKAGIISSPTGGWMDTKNFRVWVLIKITKRDRKKRLNIISVMVSCAVSQTWMWEKWGTCNCIEEDFWCLSGINRLISVEEKEVQSINTNTEAVRLNACLSPQLEVCCLCGVAEVNAHYNSYGFACR